MSPIMTAAQAAQQSIRDSGGRYAAHVHDEQDAFTPPGMASRVEVKQWPDGEVEYYLDGALHRVDGPAHVEYRDFGQPSPLRVEQFWQFGKRHRLDGPAVSHFFEADIGYGVYDDPWVEENEFWVDGVQVDAAGFAEAAAAFRAARPEGLVAASGEGAADAQSLTANDDDDDDRPDYEQVYGVEGANEFKAIHPIREALAGNGCNSGHAEARRTQTGGWEVWPYSNEEADHDDPHLWVEADGDITAYITDTDHGPTFDVGKASREWHEIDDDTAIAALLDLADN